MIRGITASNATHLQDLAPLKSHPKKIVQILRSDNSHYTLVLENLFNRSFYTTLQNSQEKLPWQRLEQIAIDCRRGSLYLHDKKIPSHSNNVFLDHTSRAKLSHFGYTPMNHRATVLWNPKQAERPGETDFCKGKYFSHRHNYKEALPHLVKAALAGHPHATLFFVLDEERVSMLPPEQVELYKEMFSIHFSKIARLADEGDAAAQLSLGLCYLKGSQILMDKSKAFKYFKLAAEQNHPHALLTLGVCFATGEVTEKNGAEAVKYLTLAKEQGHVLAMHFLATLYAQGKVVEKDISQAFKYFKMAADRGHIDASFLLGKCYEKGLGTEKDLATAVKYYTMAANLGNAQAQCCLGDMLALGMGVAKDNHQAFKYHTMAADQGNRDAQYLLGIYYQKGRGVEKNLFLASKYLKIAADKNLPLAQYHLGTHYEHGWGVPKDEARAYKYLKMAADQKYPLAIAKVREMFQQSMDVNFEKSTTTILHR